MQAFQPDWLPEPDTPHEQALFQETGFDGKLLHVQVDRVRLPSGAESVREIVRHPGSVVIVALTTRQEVLLVQQYRYATGEYLLELPAGLIDPGEEAMTTAARELMEETGHRAGTLQLLADVFASPGYSTERTRIVLATECEPAPHSPDEDEPMDIIRCPLADVPELLTAGSDRLRNMPAMLGLMWLYRLGYCPPG